MFGRHCLLLAQVLFVLSWAQAPTGDVKYSYDTAGHLVKIDYDTAGVVLYGYDAAGNLVSRKALASTDLNGDGVTNIADIQLTIKQALGLAPPVNDVNGDQVVNVVDVQIVIDSALGLI
jgi:YD repeat-containing protein